MATTRMAASSSSALFSSAWAKSEVSDFSTGILSL